MMYRQGDVFIKKISEVDLTDARKIKRENGAIVLAHGEATGHTHAIKSRDAGFFSIDGKMVLVVRRMAVNLVHQEHSPITLPVGMYEVKRQREYSPERIRHVVD